MAVSLASTRDKRGARCRFQTEMHAPLATGSLFLALLSVAVKSMLTGNTFQGSEQNAQQMDASQIPPAQNQQNQQALSGTPHHSGHMHSNLFGQAGMRQNDASKGSMSGDGSGLSFSYTQPDASQLNSVKPNAASLVAAQEQPGFNGPPGTEPIGFSKPPSNLATAQPGMQQSNASGLTIPTAGMGVNGQPNALAASNVPQPSPCKFSVEKAQQDLTDTKILVGENVTAKLKNYNKLYKHSKNPDRYPPPNMLTIPTINF